MTNFGVVGEQSESRFTAFDGFRRITSGVLLSVTESVKKYIDRNPEACVLIFDNVTSQVIDIDFRGTTEDVVTRMRTRTSQGAATASLIASLQIEQLGPGRPKLGVVAREVTLLPRHWDWLNRQPGGASVALRRLVEDARKMNAGKDRVREAQEATYRFMSAIAGDLPGFEEALRSLFAISAVRFKLIIDEWPADVRDHALRLADGVFTK